MKANTLYKFLAENIRDDEDIVFSAHCGNMSSSIREVSERANKIILSNAFNPRWSGNFSLDTLFDVFADFEDDDYDVIFRIPSIGFFRIVDVKRNHYDYSEDGDGVYDQIDIYCEEEPFCEGQWSDLRKYVSEHNIAEQYEDYDESKKALFNKLLENNNFDD